MTGTNVGTAYLEVVPSAKGFAGKLQAAVGGDMSKAGQRGGEDYSRGFGGGLKKLAGAAVGLVALDKVKDFLGDSVGAASDLNETLNKSTVIFGKNSKAIEQWAAGADKSLGLSKQGALDSAASFGDMFSQIGFGSDKAATMSKSVVQLAADLGSFNNLDTTDVLERLAGGFRGEYDALQKVIPNISAARVEQEALRQTHKKAAKDLTAAEKASATLAIVQHDGARAAGDFARTSSGLANSQKIQAAEVENLKAKIGTGLLPIQLKLTRFVADKAVPAISDFVGGMQDGTGAGGEFADVLKDTYEVGKNVIKFVDGLPGPVKKFGVEGVIAAVVLSTINAGMTRIGTSGTVSMVRGLSTAEGRMAAVEKGSYRLGVGLRNLAGAGGTVALVDGLQRMNDKSSQSQQALGGLETVAGATATGFAAGGPLGAAVGFTVSSLGTAIKTFGLFGTAAKRSNEPIKVSKQVIDSYTQSLDGSSAAITRNTRELVLQHLQQSGLLDSTRKLGLTDREAVQAMTGNTAARTKLSRALRTTTDLTNKQKDALRVETGAVGQSRLEQLRHNVAIAGSATELKTARTALRKFMAQPASKKVAITGVEDVVGQLSSIRSALRSVFGQSADLHVSGPGGIGTLLHVEGAGATGAIVRRPTLALIGESGPEALVPLNRTAGNAPLPATGGGTVGGADRFVLVLDDGTQLGGYVDRRADSRIGAQRQIDGMQRRAY